MTAERRDPIIEGFRILGVLGEGAMGVVYEAEQQEPRRHVALKVIRGGSLDLEWARRLELEARALARLNHPGIVPLLSQGRTADGTPWFAMELVEGEPLDRFVHSRSLDLRARIRLFQQIVAAVAHAHQKGVIHRDLKPSNVVVAAPGSGSSIRQTERVGYVRVLDFGLARIDEEERLAEQVEEVRPDLQVERVRPEIQVERTEPGRIVGTLAYMSPEQARGEGYAVDQRSDVYSLGVLLYQLLTDALPIDVEGCWVGEAARRIASRDPVPPRSVRRIPTDLETIVLKALEKEPTRRYQSASSLMEDVERWSAGLPILAHPPSTLYQLKKLCLRHKTWTAVIVLVLLLLLAAGPLFTWQQARQAEAIAEERDIARAVLDFQKRMLTAPQPTQEGYEVRLVEVLSRSRREIDQAYQDRPRIEILLRGVVGRAYLAIGLAEEAEPQLLRAHRLSVATHGEEHERTREAARDLDALADLLEKNGEAERAGSLRRSG